MSSAVAGGAGVCLSCAGLCRLLTVNGDHRKPALRNAAVIVFAAASVLAAGSPARAGPHAAGGRCLIAGPFRDRAAAAALTRRARAWGLAAETAARAALRVGYRVELAGFADAAAVARKVRRLRGAGWRDLLVLQRDSGGPVISLGLFDHLSDALRRGERARLLGFDPTVRSEYRTVHRWYVQVPVPASVTTLAAAVATAPRPAPCAPPAGAR